MTTESVPSTATATTSPAETGERADLLRALAKARYFLRHTVSGLSDAQAGLRPTASALCLGGLIKHVAATEAMWADFIVHGPRPEQDVSDLSQVDWGARQAEFDMRPEDTLPALLAGYAEVAERTDDLVRTLPDLDASHPLPAAPWFEPGAVWSARQALLHIVAETAQHAGHADIIRESIDGRKSMG